MVEDMVEVNLPNFSMIDEFEILQHITSTY